MEEANDNEESISFKIILLGNGKVGKTSYILRFCDDKFEIDSLTTIGIDTKTKYIKRRNKKINYRISKRFFIPLTTSSSLIVFGRTIFC